MVYLLHSYRTYVVCFRAEHFLSEYYIVLGSGDDLRTSLQTLNFRVYQLMNHEKSPFALDKGTHDELLG